MYTAVRTQSCLSISAAGWLSPLETPINIPQWPRLVSLLKPSLTRTELPSHLIVRYIRVRIKGAQTRNTKTQNRWSKEPPQPVVAFPQRLVGHRATVSTALPDQAPESGSAGEKGVVVVVARLRLDPRSTPIPTAAAALAAAPPWANPWR
ncbi:hypothetical protein TsFJ059_003376 [Trichoderma semiorbis]|uniref:Uncharacterized protein n=1 Tax=Trichoderma semiorbis TaxID=1491008 RepID=A0A9P8HII4_9HYPO|nr:hypothetical protein TsFJ059_003376 [Trichoderma semiorbis]